jgi:hypothetical protein
MVIKLTPVYYPYQAFVLFAKATMLQIGKKTCFVTLTGSTSEIPATLNVERMKKSKLYNISQTCQIGSGFPNTVGVSNPDSVILKCQV